MQRLIGELEARIFEDDGEFADDGGEALFRRAETTQSLSRRGSLHRRRLGLDPVATQVFPFFEIPNWTVRLVVLGLVLCFPIATILAWAYDITPSGLKRTEDIAPGPLGTGPKAFGAAATSAPEISHRAAVPEERPSIAVLPFSNMSGDPEQDYFSDGITEDLITDLSKVSGLFVVARHSAFAYKARPIKAQQIGA